MSAPLIVRFRVDGQPVSRQTVWARRYHRYRAQVFRAAQRAMRGLPTHSPVAVEIVYRSAFASDADGAPDLDNIAKGILDGMQKVVYSDDRQVQDLRIRRVAVAAQPEQVVVTVRRHPDVSGGALR